MRLKTFDVDDRVTPRISSAVTHYGPAQPLERLYERVDRLEDELRSVVRCLQESQWNDEEDALHLQTIARRISRVLEQ